MSACVRACLRACVPACVHIPRELSNSVSIPSTIDSVHGCALILCCVCPEHMDAAVMSGTNSHRNIKDIYYKSVFIIHHFETHNRKPQLALQLEFQPFSFCQRLTRQHQHQHQRRMNLRELRAELRKLGLPTTGRKRELEQRLAGDARCKALDKDTGARSMEGAEDTLVQGAEKPDRMKKVSQ